MPKHKTLPYNSHDGKADLPTSVKLRAFRCQDFADMPRKHRLAYAKAVHAAIRADNQRRGQSYKPAWRNIGQCQAAYDKHMEGQRLDRAVASFALDLIEIVADININPLAA